VDAPTIAAVVLTLNEASHIADCIKTLTWADDVLVFDSFSSDGTVARATAAGARVIQNAFENYAQQRNAALAAVEATWVFFVDADERMDAALAAEVRAAAASGAHDVWSVPRHNYLFGKLTLGAGWYPDFQARLFRVGHSGYDPTRHVHELPVFSGELGKLTRELTHFNYATVAQFHAKQRKYSDHDAQILFNQGVRPKPRNFVLQPAREFWRRFVTWRGYRDGLHGVRLSLLMAFYNLRMYRKLAVLWRAASA
jgi:(heptosyl)LPS beta-1,4-glucosyltransferase